MVLDVVFSEAGEEIPVSFAETIRSDAQGTVYSVNGKTGAVTLDASDVGALPDDTVIPTKTSDLTNDSGYRNFVQVNSAIETALQNYRTASAQDAIDAGKQAKITASGLLKGDGSGGVSAAVAGTDYETPAGAKALGLTGASVGDLVRVASVDANGKPTSWRKAPLCEIRTNPNLLDNWYFINPVNQRGLSIYNITNSREMSIDRWFGYDGRQAGKIEVTSDGVSITKTSGGDGIYFGQKLEQDLTGKTATFTVLTSTGTLFTGSAVIANNVAFISAWPNIRGSALIENGRTVIQIYVYAASLTIKAVKLELGTEQTLAHNEGTEANPNWVLNEIPNYETELIKCNTSTADPSDIYANKIIGYNVSNPNLLDNWYFVGGGSQRTDVSGAFPINQRGLTTYPNPGYTIDRWRMWTGSLTVNGQNITYSTANENGLFQYFDAAFRGRMLGKTITVSALLSDGTLWYGTGVVPNNTSVSIRSGADNRGYVAFFTDFTSTAYLCGFAIHLFANQSVSVVAVKLELGSEQTLAHQENGQWVLNEIPNYCDELVKCRRFYRRNFNGVSPSVSSGYSYFIAQSNTTNTQPVVQWDSPMRAAPSVTIYSLDGTSGAIMSWKGDRTVTDITTTYVTPYGFSIANLTGRYGTDILVGESYVLAYEASADL